MRNYQTNILYADASPLKNKVSFDVVFQLLPATLQKTIQSKNNFEDQMLSLSAQILVQQLLQSANIKAQISYSSEGKPLLISNDKYYISITHRYPYVACALSKYPVGIDIESQDTDFTQIIKHYYSDKEKRFLKSCLNPQYESTKLWCRKECYIKYDKPQELRGLDVLNAPEDYFYLSIPLQDHAFEVLMKNGAYHYEIFDIAAYLKPLVIE